MLSVCCRLHNILNCVFLGERRDCCHILTFEQIVFILAFGAHTVYKSQGITDAAHARGKLIVFNFIRIWQFFFYWIINLTCIIKMRRQCWARIWEMDIRNRIRSGGRVSHCEQRELSPFPTDQKTHQHMAFVCNGDGNNWHSLPR